MQVDTWSYNKGYWKGYDEASKRYAADLSRLMAQLEAERIARQFRHDDLRSARDVLSEILDGKVA